MRVRVREGGLAFHRARASRSADSVSARELRHQHVRPHAQHVQT